MKTSEIVIEPTCILAALVRRGQTENRSFPHCLRGGGGLFFNDGRPVTTLDDMVEFLGAAEESEVVQERQYCGHDYQNMLVVRVKCPEGFHVQLQYMRLEDLKPFKSPHRCYVEMRSYGGDYGMVTKSIETPLRADQPFMSLSREQMSSKYNWVTFKIDKRDLVLKSWLPGLDTQAAPALSPGKMFVQLDYPVAREKEPEQQPPQPVRKLRDLMR